MGSDASMQDAHGWARGVCQRVLTDKTYTYTHTYTLLHSHIVYLHTYTHLLLLQHPHVVGRLSCHRGREAPCANERACQNHPYKDMGSSTRPGSVFFRPLCPWPFHPTSR